MVCNVPNPTTPVTKAEKNASPEFFLLTTSPSFVHHAPLLGPDEKNNLLLFVHPTPPAGRLHLLCALDQKKPLIPS